MPICSDPAITYLKDSGYSVLRLPRQDFTPLQILAKQGRDLVPLGPLADVMVPESQAALPAIKPDGPAATINGTRSSDVSVGVGIHILGNIIGAMGGGNLGLNASYKNARTVGFEFTGVLQSGVDITKLDQFLGASDINPASKHLATLFEADDVYVVTAIIKSARFTIEAKTQTGVGVGLSVPEIQQIVGGSVNVTAAGASTGKITYEGQVPLVFGFQAVQLFYQDGKYTAFEPLPTGTTAAKAIQKPPFPASVKGFKSAGPFAPLA